MKNIWIFNNAGNSCGVFIFFFWKWARICHYWFYFCKNVVVNVVGNQTCIDFLKLNTTAFFFFVLFFSIYLPQTVLLCFEMFKSTYQWWNHQMPLLTFHTRKGLSQRQSLLNTVTLHTLGGRCHIYMHLKCLSWFIFQTLGCDLKT